MHACTTVDDAADAANRRGRRTIHLTIDQNVRMFVTKVFC
jgi:hypothetical protein